MSYVSKMVAAVGAAVVVLYSGWVWGAQQIVWASEFKAAQEQNQCRFDRLERVGLEGQMADVIYRIGQYTQKKLITPEEAKDLAVLNVRKDNIQRQLNELGADCDKTTAKKVQTR